MKTIYLRSQEFSTLAIDVEPDGAEVAGYGEAAEAFFSLELTDAERLLLVAALLRDKETVSRTSEASATVEKTEGGEDE